MCGGGGGGGWVCVASVCCVECVWVGVCASACMCVYVCVHVHNNTLYYVYVKSVLWQ